MESCLRELDAKKARHAFKNALRQKNDGFLSVR